MNVNTLLALLLALVAALVVTKLFLLAERKVSQWVARLRSKPAEPGKWLMDGYQALLDAEKACREAESRQI